MQDPNKRITVLILKSTVCKVFPKGDGAPQPTQVRPGERVQTTENDARQLCNAGKAKLIEIRGEKTAGGFEDPAGDVAAKAKARVKADAKAGARGATPAGSGAQSTPVAAILAQEVHTPPGDPAKAPGDPQ